MRELQEALGRFVSGVIDEDEFCTFVRSFVRERPQHHADVLKWLQERVGSGRLSAAVGMTIERALTAAYRKFEPDDTGPRTRTRPGRPSRETALLPVGDATIGRPADVAVLDDPDTEACVGTILGGRFALVESLGEGGMGRVFKARDALLEEAKDRRPFVAVKVLGADFKRHPDSFIALQREVKRTRELIHENVIRVYELHRDGPHVYMSMELLEGRPLDALMRGEYVGGLTLDRAQPIVLGIGAALQYGHKHKIVHSDLKPGNVFVCDDGRIKVLDFGIARPMALAGDGSDSTLFDPGKRLGALTPAYAALEMWERQPPDPRDDIYALACMTYELLAGRHPFDRKAAPVARDEKLEPQRIATLSRPQWQAIRKGLALQRGDRTLTVAEFLEPFVPASFFKRHRVPILAAVVAVVAVGAALGAPYARDWMDWRAISVYHTKPPPARTDLSPDEARRIDDFLYLANTTLEGVTPATAAADFSYALSEGVNSANDSVERVLAIDPGNRQGLALRERIAELYAERAKALFDAGKFAAASALVGYGREIYYSLDLYRLERAICDEDPASCRPMQAP